MLNKNPAALVILGPIGWRKFAAWRQNKARTLNSPTARRPFFSLPRPLILPSNLLLTAAFITLVYLHASPLLLSSKVLSRSDLFLITRTSVDASASSIRSRVASMSFGELGWDREWGEEGLETLLRRLSSFDGRVSAKSVSTGCESS